MGVVIFWIWHQEHKQPKKNQQVGPHTKKLLHRKKQKPHMEREAVSAKCVSSK